MTDFIETPANKGSSASRKLIRGVAVNDAAYITEYRIDGRRAICPYYRTWRDMLERCYSKSYQERQPTYRGCSVVGEWLIFSNFRAWMRGQDWNGKELDKDILEFGNKIYCPEKCAFVTRGLNGLLCSSLASRGAFPLGVSRDKRTGRFQARCRVGGICRHLGYFITPDKAAATYNVFKANEIRRIANLQTDIRIRNGLLRHAELRLAG